MPDGGTHTTLRWTIWAWRWIVYFARREWQNAPQCYCGFLDWTVATYGRLTHKHGCPARVEPFCQSHPKGCPDA